MAARPQDTGAATPVCLSPGRLAELRRACRERKAEQLTLFAQARPTGPSAARLLKTLARDVDQVLATLWAECGLRDDAALVAVGGYGRGELFPHSDVDVLVVMPADDEAGEHGPRATLEAFITACWDIGLEIGSSVRTIAQCVAEGQRDVTVQTAMLESRRLAGSARLFQQFVKAQTEAMDPRAFLRAKMLELRQRHVKYEDTPYALEPNCKESPGGLRDLQVVMWVARAAGLGRTWGELAARGIINAFEAKQLHRHEGMLKLMRAGLHRLAGRREDRLVFDLQTALAESFGITATRTQRASEALMHRYYWAAKAVSQLNQILLQGIEERVMGSTEAPMRPINARFLDRAGMLEVARDDLYLDNPHAILETFLVAQQTPGIKGLSARTLRALYNARSVMDAKFRRDPLNRELFMDVLRQPSGHTHALRWMNQTSVLGRYLWVFRRIVGRMQHDLFHVYTVDQHIIIVLRNMRRFFIPEHAHEYPFCSQLAGGWDKPWVLYLAALFHDVAKGRGGDHSDLGAMEARRFCRDHGIERDDTQLIEFLVKQHLTMSRVAQKEDLSDAAVIQAFARLMGTERRLTALYLLTVADIRGTSPKVWNAWKGKLLEDLYRRTLRALGGAQPNLDAEIEARKQDARQDLALHCALPGTEEALWRTLDVGYFARHDAGEIAWHVRSLWRHLDTATPVVRARPSPIGEGLQVLVYSRDRPDLFARICGYFDSAGFSIQDAKIHTSRTRYALDTFQVIHPAAEHEATAHRDLIALVELQATQALASTGPLPEPRRGRLSRRVKSFPITPRISLAPDEGAQRWLMSITTSDRTGLLYAVARVLARHQINLQLAKITTLGERVEDTFLLDGALLQQSRAQLQIESELLDAVSPVAA